MEASVHGVRDIAQRTGVQHDMRLVQRATPGGPPSGGSVPSL